MSKYLLSAWRCSNGSTAVEYAVIASLMALAVVLGITNIGASLEGALEIVAALL